MGVGVGISGLSLQAGENFVPVFGEIRGYLTKKRVAPYYVLGAGYGFALKNENQSIVKGEGGLLIQPTFGIRIGASSKANILIDAGYKFQKAVFTREFFNGDQEIKEISYRRFTFRFGFIF